MIEVKAIFNEVFSNSLNNRSKNIIRDYHKERNYSFVAYKYKLSVEGVRKIVNNFLDDMFAVIENQYIDIVDSFYKEIYPNENKIEIFYLTQAINKNIPYINKEFEYKCLICGSKMEVGFDCPICGLSSLQKCSNRSYKVMYVGIHYQREEVITPSKDLNRLIFYIKKNKVSFPVIKKFWNINVKGGNRRAMQRLFNAFILSDNNVIEKFVNLYEKNLSNRDLEKLSRSYTYKNPKLLIELYKKSRFYNINKGFIAFQYYLMERNNQVEFTKKIS